MSDKLRANISVTPTFTDGESPPAAKLNSISVQMRAASEALEKAIGDIHSQSFPYVSGSLTTLSPAWSKRTSNGNELTSTAERDLDIANLARLIGPASNMNPRMLGKHEITESVPVGRHEFQLTFDPSNVPTFSNGTVFATNVTNLSNLKNAGEYHVTDEGIVYCISFTTGGTVTYETNPLFKGGGLNPQHARFNVLPDPNQIAAGGAGLSWSAPDAQGRRTATLPTITHAQSNYDGNSTTLTTEDPIFGEQLKLPKVLVDNLTPGTTIPGGILYVKNETTNEVYEDAEYIADTETTVIMGNVDITDDINAGHKFSIITVGNDITSSIDDLRRKTFHSHDRTFGEPGIHIQNIVGIHENKTTFGSQTTVPSDRASNWMPQYLQRVGWSRSYDSSNINDQNAMRGPLLLGKSAGPVGSYVASIGQLSVESQRIYFSNELLSIYRNSSDDLVLLNTASGGGITLDNSSPGGGDIALLSGNDIRLNASGLITAETEFVTSVGLRGPESTSAKVKLYADNSYLLDSPASSPKWHSVGDGVNGPALPAGITNIIALQFWMKSNGETTWYPPNVTWVSGSRNYNYGLRVNDTGGDWSIRVWDDGGNTSKWVFAEQGVNIECKFMLWYV